MSWNLRRILLFLEHPLLGSSALPGPVLMPAFGYYKYFPKSVFAQLVLGMFFILMINFWKQAHQMLIFLSFTLKVSWTHNQGWKGISNVMPSIPPPSHYTALRGMETKAQKHVCMAHLAFGPKWSSYWTTRHNNRFVWGWGSEAVVYIF